MRNRNRERREARKREEWKSGDSSGYILTAEAAAVAMAATVAVAFAAAPAACFAALAWSPAALAAFAASFWVVSATWLRGEKRL